MKNLLGLGLLMVATTSIASIDGYLKEKNKIVESICSAVEVNTSAVDSPVSLDFNNCMKSDISVNLHNESLMGFTGEVYNVDSEIKGLTIDGQEQTTVCRFYVSESGRFKKRISHSMRPSCDDLIFQN